MKLIIIATCSLLLGATQLNKTRTISAVPQPKQSDGWVSLFDGKTTKGWHVFQNKSDGSAWKAENGTLTLDTLQKKDWQVVGGGDLVTDKEYGNFDLKLEWKISPKGNSGIIFYVHEDPAKYDETYKTGLEMQVLDNDGHSDGKILKHRAGDLYDLIKSSSEPVKKVGEWNQAEIICSNGHLELILNGVKVVTTTLWNDNWKTLIAGSKFKNMPDWGTFKSGKIALQDHGNAVWYRNIRIKNL